MGTGLRGLPLRGAGDLPGRGFPGTHHQAATRALRELADPRCRWCVWLCCLRLPLRATRASTAAAPPLWEDCWELLARAWPGCVSMLPASWELVAPAWEVELRPVLAWEVELLWGGLDSASAWEATARAAVWGARLVAGTAGACPGVTEGNGYGLLA